MSNGDKPKARKKRISRPPLSPALRQLAVKAIAKHRQRPVPPKVVVQGDEFSLSVSSPYAPRDHDAWTALLFEAFGTRSISVATHFLKTLAGLVERQWDGKAQKWTPDQSELDAIIAMVNSMKPRNEAQAAYAAQLCALHLSAMRLAKYTTSHCADARSVAVLNKTVRAYGDGLINLGRLQGKRRSSKQVIKVETHKHVHQHIHVNGGRSENGGQPHATDSVEQYSDPARASAIEASAAMPGQGPFGSIVPLASREGQAMLPDARRSKGQRSTKG